MLDPGTFRHAGGGRKGLFIVLRYVFIVAASYLLIFQNNDAPIGSGPALMIAMALASNVALSMLPAQYVFAWYIEAPVMVADTLWVSWALHQTGASGQELFLLYFFVLFLAGVGEKPVLALLGSTAVSAANLYFTEGASLTNPRDLLRIVFFYTVALFYGHVLSQIKHERQRADRGFAWARALEAKVAERTSELRRLYGRSLEASRLKSEFVASMSHELRTPLNIILGYTEMLLDRDAPLPEAERDGVVRRAREAAQNLLQLVDAVLDVGKLDAGKVPLEWADVAFSGWLVQQRARERRSPHPGVELVWVVPPNLPSITTDPAKLRIVLDNLVDNALKFTRRGRITVTARHVAESDAIVLRVDDDGPGLTAHDRAKIFDAFYQAGGADERREGGVGLGLAIVDRYARLLGGTVEVTSKRGVGSSFVVTLPCRIDEALRAA